MSAHIVPPGSVWVIAANSARKLSAPPAPPQRYPDRAFPARLWRIAALLAHPVVERPRGDAAPCRDWHVLSVRPDARGELVPTHRPLWPGRCRRGRMVRLNVISAEEVGNA